MLIQKREAVASPLFPTGLSLVGDDDTRQLRLQHGRCIQRGKAASGLCREMVERPRHDQRDAVLAGCGRHFDALIHREGELTQGQFDSAINEEGVDRLTCCVDESDNCAGACALRNVLIRASSHDSGSDDQRRSTATTDDAERLQLARVILGDVVDGVDGRSSGADGEGVTVLDIGNVGASNRERHATVIGRQIARHRARRERLRAVRSRTGHSADADQVRHVIGAERLETSDIRHTRTFVSVQVGLAQVGAIAQVFRYVAVVERVHEELTRYTQRHTLRQQRCFGQCAIIPGQRANLFDDVGALLGDGIVQVAVDLRSQAQASGFAGLLHVLRIAHFLGVERVQNVFRRAEHGRNHALDDIGRRGAADIQAADGGHVVVLRTVKYVACALHAGRIGIEVAHFLRQYASGVKAFDVFPEHDFEVFCKNVWHCVLSLINPVSVLVWLHAWRHSRRCNYPSAARLRTTYQGQSLRQFLLPTKACQVRALCALASCL